MTKAEEYQAPPGYGLSLFFFAGCAASFTKVVTRANSFLKPGTKSLVPYSNKTTKLKVKNTNSRTQNKVRMTPTRRR